MTEALKNGIFQPRIEYCIYNVRPEMGSEVKIRDGRWKGSQFVPNGEVFRGTVISIGDTFVSACLSRREDDCLNCPTSFCKAPLSLRILD